MVSFTNLQQASGLQALNTHLASRSYVEGFTPSQADASLLPQVSSSVDSSKFPHIARWLHHIQAFPPQQRSKWPGQAAAASSSSGAKAASSPVKVAAKKPAADDDDDDFLGGLSSDDDEEDEADAIARRIAMKKDEEEAAARAEKARALGKKAAKSTLILDIKPEDDETDLDDLEKRIRAITMEGLLWGQCQRIPIAFGIKKLRMLSVVVDDLVSTDALQEQIDEMDGVQSSDIHAFNKI